MVLTSSYGAVGSRSPLAWIVQTPLSVATDAPMLAIRRDMVRMSTTFGSRRNATGSAVSRVAARAGRAAFLAPLMGMLPDRRRPPSICMACMGSRARAVTGAR